MKNGPIANATGPSRQDQTAIPLAFYENLLTERHYPTGAYFPTHTSTNLPLRANTAPITVCDVYGVVVEG
jgi:hypothetical protein